MSIRRVLDANADVVNVRDANVLDATARSSENWRREYDSNLDRGSEINARTGLRQEGGSALTARKAYGKGHEIVTLIESHGERTFWTDIQSFKHYSSSWLMMIDGVIESIIWLILLWLLAKPVLHIQVG
jgi:hypothetical protein